MSGEALERVVFHAALLAGEGARARAFGHFVSLAAQAGEGRSCLDGGAVVQLFLDAPGPPVFRFGVRVDQRADGAVAEDDLASGLAGLAGPDDARALADAVRGAALVRAPRSFGAWFLHDAPGATLAIDARAVPRGSLAAHLAPILGPAARARLDAQLSALDAAPWALVVSAEGGRVTRVALRWSLPKGTHPARAALAVGGAEAWTGSADLLARVLGEAPDEHTRPWQLVTRLDEEAPPGLATSAWGRRLDVDAKRERLVRAFERLDGPWRQVDATWRLLRQGIAPGRSWIIGRGLEVRAGPDGASLRAVLVPAPCAPYAGDGAAAGRINSASELTTGADTDGLPERS